VLYKVQIVIYPEYSTSEKTGLSDMPLIIADRRHSLFSHTCWLSPEA